MTEVITFRKSYSNGQNGYRHSSTPATVVTFAGSCTKDNRSTRPTPLSDTPMTINRAYANGSFGYGKKSSTWGSISYVGNKWTRKIDDTRGEATLLSLQSRSNFAQGSFNAGVFFAELKDTSKFIQSAYKLAGDLVHSGLRDGLKKVVPTDSKRLSDSYLAIQFGLLPLVSDVQGAMEHFHRTIQTGSELAAAAGSSRRPGSTNLVTVVPPGASAPNFGDVARKSYTRGTVSDPSLRSLSELGLVNVPALLWARLPLSFVIDWFLPVGDILQAMTAGVGVSGLRTSTITEYRDTYTMNDTANHAVGWWKTSQTIYRTVDVWSTPGAGPTNAVRSLANYHVGQVLTAGALYRQRMRSL